MSVHQVVSQEQKTGLAWTAKLFRSEKGDSKIIKWGETWMFRPRGTVGWSSFNQGWFKSRAVSSRKQEQKVSTLGKATTLGFICRMRRMRIELRSTSPFFFSLSIVLAVQAHAAIKNEKQEPTGKPTRDQRVLEAARMYEKYFLGQLTKAMRASVQHSELSKPSMGESIYREQLDDQYVDSWTERGGIGLAEMIHDELVGKQEMAKEMARQRKERRKALRAGSSTMMALTDRDVMGVRKLPSTAGTSETILVSLAMPDEKTAAASRENPNLIFSPWAGRLEKVRVSKNEGSGGKGTSCEMELVLDSAGGLPTEGRSGAAKRVALIFDGVPLNVTEGDRIVVGQKLAHLAMGARGVLVRQSLD